mmetsp:Transcript_51488/g.145118  ORF Transcript_51488/g.145118 Transcript_51488/m.145118 type:complete len:222 (+) Transcript_51488:143-808(+)|eukprot:CAMPEP_0179279022 /NCGR_PEP_ID=MMETSP0797-20121207/35902_1 /TAXON_ID=47934 /ORGANISM="Dinophysis acuminata, Strain DAEP01" /LENGTH=221 /DNA_ID=CAMNT_0020987643 /DNA_START=110 /DNA_END=775 /DNA_ORIENTATION=-
MSLAEARFNTQGHAHRTTQHDDMQKAKTEYGGHLNFSAYRQGTDPQYLGVNGKTYYAKPWGNDSSNIQAVINGPSYWKRVYYRENVAARFQKDDDNALARAAEKASAAADAAPMRKSASEGAIQRMPVEDGYADIKNTMRPFAERQGKPKIKAPQRGERLNFFNTLDNKYHMKAGGKNLRWDVSKETHRSTKNEMNWILSNYFRTDTQAVLSGVGSEPAFH